MSCVNLWHKLTQLDTRQIFQKFLEKIGIKGSAIVSIRELEKYVDENFENISKIFIVYKENKEAGLYLIAILFLSLGIFITSLIIGNLINPFLGFVGIFLTFLSFFYFGGKYDSGLSRYYTAITIELKNRKKVRFNINEHFTDVYKNLRFLIGNKLVKYGILPYTQIPLGYYRLCEKHKDYLKKYLIFVTFEDYKELNDMYDELEKCRECKYIDIGKFFDFGKIVLNLEKIEKYGNWNYKKD